MALRDRRLVVTYCEGQGKEGAIVSYDFDDETGQISGPLDIQEQWFSAYGDVKGVCFDAKGERVFVTFQSDIMPWRLKLTRRLKNAVSFGSRGGPSRNGMAVFGIDQRGGLTPRPLWKKVERRFCRLENIHIVGDCGIITNPDSACVEVYDVRRDPGFRKPVQIITDSLCFPHGAKLSPDASTLVVTDNGIRMVNHVPQWGDFLPTRKDRVLVYKLQEPAALVAA
jgi:sugar lactone lactonase YvrE